jgi:ADP-ribose pyrophosphatase
LADHSASPTEGSSSDPPASADHPEVLARLGERTINSSLVYQGLFLKLRRDAARLPDGSVHEREWVVHPGASAVVALDDQERVLIERQFRYPMGRVYLEIPAGKIDAGETPLQTMRRELVEETGYQAAQWAPLTQIHPAIGFSNEIIHLFLARDLTRVDAGASPDHGELIEIEWVPLGWLVDELRAGRLPDVKTQIGVMHLQQMVQGAWPWPAFAAD